MVFASTKAPRDGCRYRSFRRDIIFGVMWSVALGPEVEQWIDSRTGKEFAAVLPHIERLRRWAAGIALRPQPAAWRIAYFFAPDRRIMLLAVFRKQR